MQIGNLGKDELSIAIEDNGPGIVEENVPNVFGSGNDKDPFDWILEL